MSELLYRRLLPAIDGEGSDLAEVEALLAQLGAPAWALRGATRARRRRWSSAAADFATALEQPGCPAIVELLCGAGLFACRRYHESLQALARAAAHGKPGVAAQARKLALELTLALGWREEAQAWRAPGGEPRESESEAEAEAESESESESESLDRPDLEARLLDLAADAGPARAAAVIESLRTHADAHRLPLLRAQIRVDLLLGQRARAEQRLASCSADEREQLAPLRALLPRLRDDAKAVVVRTTHHHHDPELLYHRAWALAELGALSEAADLLEHARSRRADAIHLQLALALLDHRADPDSFAESIERRFELLLDGAPALLADAARLAGVELWTDTEPAPERATKVAILTAAQRLLSEDLDLARPSYRPVEADPPLRRLRPLQLERVGASHLADLHAHDMARLQQLEQVLMRALGIQAPARAAVVAADDHDQDQDQDRDRPWIPQTLSPAQIEGFLDDGFVVLEGAFDPALARAWREDAIRRIRDEPERWVRGYDPSDPDRSLRRFDPADRRTWTWPRIELHGPETVEIAAFSPIGWGAICDLLGGPERIETKTWRNYLILNLCAEAPHIASFPSPGLNSWHIDDPSPTTRIDRIRNGLVAIALFDDLLPDSGNTWLALDSVPRVARALAAHPEGIDFARSHGSGITQECRRFHEVVGKAGDLLLMHPLMMHSASPNRSGRIRWMGNPMVYLQQPLAPLGPDHRRSPVETAIWRAVQGVDASG